ncbi:MAG TPA: methylenetetrahydrofolate reductase [Solirubrobacteraceae bacterium]
MSVSVSFEVFPPRSAQAEPHLHAAIDQLAELDPAFVSVTCGAGGTARTETLATIEALGRRRRLPIAGHLTCAGCERDEVTRVAEAYWAAGVRHIVALRGDMPELGAPFRAHPGGYAGALELIDAVRRVAPFEISVAAYPEPHPESHSLQGDLDHLARKAAAGATRAITQFCFDTRAIVRLRENVSRARVELSIVPGIMLASNFAALERMASRCGADLPGWLTASFAGLDDDAQTRKLLTAIVAARQVEELRREGFDEFHFYTLNQADVCTAVCRLLDGRPRVAEARAA